MISIFKTNLFINSLMLLPYSLILRLPSLIWPQKTEEIGTNFLQEGVLKIVQGSPVASYVITSILIFLHAILINRIVIKNRLHAQITLLPGMIYIILANAVPQASFPNMALINMLLILGCLNAVYQSYREPKSAILVFDTGFLVGLATLLYKPSWLFIFIFLIAFIMLRAMKLKHVMQLFIGFVTPTLLMLCYEYLTYTTLHQTLNYVRPLLTPNVVSFSNYSQWIIFASIVVVAIVLLLKYGTYVAKKSIPSQRKIDILFWMMAASGVGLIICGEYPPHYLYLCIPAAVFLGQHISEIKEVLQAEMIHLVSLALLVVAYIFA